MSEKKKKRYIMFDPIHNFYMNVGNYNKKLLASQYEKGFKFYAEYDNGQLEEIGPEDVVEIAEETHIQQMTMAKTQYVDKKIDMILDVIESVLNSIEQTISLSNYDEIGAEIKKIRDKLVTDDQEK